MARACAPGVGEARQARAGFLGTLGLVDGLGLLQQLSPCLFVGIAFEFLAALVGDIA